MISAADLVLTPCGLRFLGRRFPCSIGKGGLTEAKREGDGATPAGVLRITGMYYRPDRLRAPAPWAQAIGPRDLWSDDAGDARYNQHVRAPYAGSHERLRRADPLYDLVLATDWNWPQAEPGRGSGDLSAPMAPPRLSDRRLPCVFPARPALDRRTHCPGHADHHCARAG